MEAPSLRDKSLCRVAPDPIFVHPVPNALHPATAKFHITNLAGRKLAYKIRYGKKHPQMKIRINVDNKGILSRDQRLGVHVSLMPGYDVVENESDSFVFCIYTIPVDTVDKLK